MVHFGLFCPKIVSTLDKSLKPIKDTLMGKNDTKFSCKFPSPKKRISLLNVRRAAKLGSSLPSAQWVSSVLTEGPLRHQKCALISCNVHGGKKRILPSLQPQKRPLPPSRNPFLTVSVSTFIPEYRSPHLFSAQNRQFLHIGDEPGGTVAERALRTLLGYHSLISGSYRGSPLLERAFDDDDQRILLHQFNQLEGF